LAVAAVGLLVFAAACAPPPPPSPPQITLQVFGSCTPVSPPFYPGIGDCGNGDQVAVTYVNGTANRTSVTSNLPFSIVLPRQPDGVVAIFGQVNGIGWLSCLIAVNGVVVNSSGPTSNRLGAQTECSAQT
jgi:hypothetical protein